MSSTPNQTYWRRKLHALLHDSPDKATSIFDHEYRAKQLKAIFQFEEDEEFKKEADHRASSADRLPFPSSQELKQPLEEIEKFPHPLGGSSIPNAKFKSASEALEVSQKTHPYLLKSEDAHASFLCIWRFWRNWAASIDERFTRLPADTRIPDHTIWNHINVTTAFQGSLPEEGIVENIENAPRLLLFSIGPVQDFIAAARSTRDLWSGSYLLSWLVSHALGQISEKFGPDHLIFPNLLDQPLIDLQLNEIYKNHRFSMETVWDGFDYTGKNISKLLTPSLPNRFMALLPARVPGTDTAVDDYAKELAQDIRVELSNIAKSVRKFVETHPNQKIVFRAEEFNAQVKKLLEIQWQLLPIPTSLDELWNIADKLLPPDSVPPSDSEEASYTPRKAVGAILEMVEKPECKPAFVKKDGKLYAETGWALLNALIAYLHDGTKTNRAFTAWREGRWDAGKDFNKDALNGREEAVFRAEFDNDQQAEDYCSQTLQLSKGTFKSGENLGASTLIKRLWHHTYLPGKIGITAHELHQKHPMPNTHAIAMGCPFDDSGNEEDTGSRSHSEKYFAVLALDGDEMGKWVSGSKTPKVREQLSPKAVAFYQKNAPAFLKAPRAVTPSWHLQFAEALGNFSFHAVQRIVEAFDGRLIYAGGDDVLAMLPAKDALPCARALRAAFRGELSLNEVKGKLTGNGTNKRSDRTTRLFNILEGQEGFLRLHKDQYQNNNENQGTSPHKGLISDPVDFSAIVPGLRADVSVGIAIAHFKAPLQDVVRAAQAAEKRAKRSIKEGGHGRGAFALTIYKRSGEVLEWGSRWAKRDSQKNPTSDETAGYRLLKKLTEALAVKQLNGRFPHKLESLLAPYGSHTSSALKDDMQFEEQFNSVLKMELKHCLDRNEGGKVKTEDQQEFISLFEEYWKELKAEQGLPFSKRLTQLINLLRTAAWSVRGV